MVWLNPLDDMRRITIPGIIESLQSQGHLSLSQIACGMETDVSRVAAYRRGWRSPTKGELVRLFVLVMDTFPDYQNGFRSQIT